MIMDVFCFSISLGHLYLLRTRSNPATQIRRVPVALPNAAPRCMAHKTVAGLGAVITANGMRRWRWAWKTRISGPESPTRISQGWSLPWARVELPKNGNWRLQRAEHCVAGSERAPWDGLSVLPLEPLSVSYGCSATGPNQKTTP